MEVNSLTIFVNRECNLDCKYCFVNNIGLKLEWSDKIKNIILDFVKQTDNFTISFLGGEPLLNFDFIKNVILYVEELKLKFKGKKINIGTINTNGTIYNYEMFRFLFKHDIELQFSIDNFLYNKIDKYRIHKDIKDYKLYEIIENNIKNYKSIYNKAPNMSIVLTKENMGSLYNIIKYYVEKIGINNISISQLIVKTNFIDEKSVEVFRKEYVKIFYYYLNNLLKYNLQIDPIEEIVEEYLHDDFVLERLSTCSIGESVYLGANGIFYTCTYLAGQGITSEKNSYGDIYSGFNFGYFLTRKEKSNQNNGSFGAKIGIDKMFCLREGYKKGDKLLNEILYKDSIRIPLILIRKNIYNLNNKKIRHLENKYGFKRHLKKL